jgi:hypothetical protein
VYSGHRRVSLGTSSQKILKTFGRGYPASNFITGKVDCAGYITTLLFLGIMIVRKYGGGKIVFKK